MRNQLPVEQIFKGRAELVALVDEFDPISQERASLYLQLLGEYLLAGPDKRRALDRRLCSLEAQIVLQGFRLNLLNARGV